MRDEPLWALLLTGLICFVCDRPAEPREPAPLRDRIEYVLNQGPYSQFDAAEPTESRLERLADITDAINKASRNDSEAAILLAIGEVESYWARYVTLGCIYPEGIPKGAPDCDKGKSRSPWQLQNSACRPGWALPRGSKAALDAFAVCARKRFLASLKQCRGAHPGGDLAGAFSLYATGNRCAWEGSKTRGARARVRVYYRKVGMLGR